MALVLGTNCGFVTVAPSADPGGTDFGIDARSAVTKDTSPATAAKITEIGWYCDNATEEANFELGLYAANGATVPGEAGTRLQVAAVNAKGTGVGWKKATVDWTISPSTAYWLGAQLDDTPTATNTNYAASAGGGYDWRAGQTALTDPYAGGALADVDGMIAIYAVWEAASGGSSIPVKMHHYMNN